MIKLKIRGTQQVISNINRKRLQIGAGTSDWINKSTNLLQRQIRNNIDETCHSLQDLADMDHPYARAHLLNPHSPYWLVHKQSGTMKAALTKESATEVAVGRNKISGRVGYTLEGEEACKSTPSSRHSYLRCVIFGTQFMIQRDFLTRTLEDQTRFGILDFVNATIGRAVRRPVGGTY